MMAETSPARAKIARRWRARVSADLTLSDTARSLAIRADELAEDFDLAAFAFEAGRTRAEAETALRELAVTGWVRILPGGSIFRIYARGRRIAAQRPEAFANDTHIATAR